MKGISAVLLDVDGVLCLGDRPIPGAAEAVTRLKEAGYAVRIVSNNSQLGFRGMHEKLLRLGLPVDAHELILATQVLARRLAETSPRATVYALGSAGLQRDLQDEGLRVIQTPEEIDYLCDYLVVGTDWEINYERLTRALRVLLRGAGYAAVNRDKVFPSDDGPTPGTGAIVGAVKGMTDRDPDFFAGKPEPALILAACESAGHPPERCLMVGDTASTDLAAARAAGCPCCLVQTGNGTRDAGGDDPPEMRLPSVADLPAALGLPGV